MITAWSKQVAPATGVAIATSKPLIAAPARVCHQSIVIRPSCLPNRPPASQPAAANRHRRRTAPPLGAVRPVGPVAAPPPHRTASAHPSLTTVYGGADALGRAVEAGTTAASRLDTHHGRHSIVGALLHRVHATDEQIMLTLDRAALERLVGVETTDDDPLVVTGPATRIRRGNEVRLVVTAGGEASAPDPALLALMMEAYAARELMLAAPDASFRAIARDTSRCATRLRKLVGLSRLAPEIVKLIAEGLQPARLTASILLDIDLPAAWGQQKHALAIL